VNTFRLQLLHTRTRSHQRIKLHVVVVVVVVVVRMRDERPRDPVHCDFIRAAASAVDLPVIAK